MQSPAQITPRPPRTPATPEIRPLNPLAFPVPEKIHTERTDKSSPHFLVIPNEQSEEGSSPSPMTKDPSIRCAAVRDDGGTMKAHGCARRSPRAKTGWSPERRAKQSAMMRARKIWLKSTGPKTAQGKATSSQNARKPVDPEIALEKLMRQFLRHASRYTTLVNQLIWQETLRRRAAKKRQNVDQHSPADSRKSQNELLDSPPSMFFPLSRHLAVWNTRKIKILCETSVPSVLSVVNPFLYQKSPANDTTPTLQKTVSLGAHSLYPRRKYGFTESIKVRFFPLFLLALLFSFAFMAEAKAQADLSVNSLRIGTYPDKTRIVIDVSKKAEFRAFMLEKPSRLVIDLPTFAWQAISTRPPAGSLVTAIRNGVLEPGISRIVIDIEKQVTLKDAFFLPSGPGISDRVVIDFAPVSGGYSFSQERMFGNLASKGGKLNLEPAMKSASPQTLQAPKEIETAYNLKPAAEAENAPAPPKSRKGPKPLIVIDPGHGGQDPGALGANGTKEKTVTLATAQELKRQLENTGRYRVHLTRSTDIFIKLQDRVAIGREKGADLFISLHADSIDKPGVSGASIYTLSNKASDAQTAKLAARENRADLIAGVDLSHEDKQVANILIDLAMRDTMNQSKFFANSVVKNAQRQGIRMLEKPHRFAGFAVLKAPDVPSVLIEMGFMSNKHEVSQLSSPAYRQKIAASVLAGIDAYFSKVQKNGQN